MLRREAMLERDGQKQPHSALSGCEEALWDDPGIGFLLMNGK